MIADDVGIDWVMAAWVTLTTYMLTIPSSVTTAFFCPEIKGTRHNCLGILKTKCTNGTAEQTIFIPQKTVLKNLQVHVTYFWVSFLRRKDEKFGFYRCSWLLLSENLFTCFSSHLIQLEWFLTISHYRLPSGGVTKFKMICRRGRDCEPSSFSTLVKTICILRWKLLDKNFVLMHDICNILRITDRIDTL